MRPLVLLDVDGVLNAVGPPDDAWPEWRRGTARAGGRAWPVRWSPGVVAAVRGWQDTADVSWLTTWGHDANLGLRELLDLPELPVAGTHADADHAPATALPAPAKAPATADPATADPADGDAAAAAGPALAAVTPAAPDALTGAWWKFDVVRRLVQTAPERRLVWVDDDLAHSDAVRAWMRAHTTSLLVAPDPFTGLVQRHLDAVERFLAD